MRKIKFLHGFLVVLIVLYIIHFFTLLHLFSKFPEIYNKTIFNIPIHYLAFGFSILLFLGLVLIQVGLFFTIRRGVFNGKSSLLFKRGGFLIMVSGLLSFILGVSLFWINKEETYIHNILYAVPTLIIGFGLIIVSDFIKKGGILKQENELTI